MRDHNAHNAWIARTALALTRNGRPLTADAVWECYGRRGLDFRPIYDQCNGPNDAASAAAVLALLEVEVEHA